MPRGRTAPRAWTDNSNLTTNTNSNSYYDTSIMMIYDL